MMDILYLKILLFSNDGHYVEEHQSGLHILNKVNNLNQLELRSSYKDYHLLRNCI